MCDYANYLERKARNEGISQRINQGKKIERKEYRVCKKTNGKITNVI